MNCFRKDLHLLLHHRIYGSLWWYYFLEINGWI